MVRMVWTNLAVALIVAGIAGCGVGDRLRGDASRDAPEPPSAIPQKTPTLRAPGLTELPDGRVQVLGRLARIDLEGGFWAIVEGVGAQQGTGDVVAVIANADEWDRTLDALEGTVVVAVGRRFEGASIRMAGPEIVVESIEAAGSVPGAPK